MQQIFGEGMTSFFRICPAVSFSVDDVILGGALLRLRGGPVGHAGLRRPLQRKPHHRQQVTVAQRERHAGHGGQVQRPRHASEGSYKRLSRKSNARRGELWSLVFRLLQAEIEKLTHDYLGLVHFPPLLKVWRFFCIL